MEISKDLEISNPRFPAHTLCPTMRALMKVKRQRQRQKVDDKNIGSHRRLKEARDAPP